MSSRSRSVSSAAVMVELYENEVFKNNEWQPHTKMPWVSALDNGPCTPRDEYETLGEEWQWTCNWKVKYKQTQEVDVDGWEYASKLDRLYSGGSRVSRGEAKWSDKARRRLWYRLMKREVKKAIEIRKAIPRIQENLSSVHDTRLKIEGLIGQSAKSAESPELQELVEKVTGNIYDLLDALDQLEEANGNGDTMESKRYIAVLKKLRNDCLREEDALLKAAGKKGLLGGVRQRGAAGGTERVSRPSKRGFIGGTGANGRYVQPPPDAEDNKTSRTSFTSIGSSGKGNKKGELNLPVRDVTDYPSHGGDLENKQGGGIALARSPGGGGTLGASGASRGALASSVFMNDRSGRSSAEGDFVPRDTNELMIEQKLVPVDEATLMQELIDERVEQIEAMNKGIVEVQEAFTDLNRLVRQQSVDIQAIFENTEESAEKSKAGLESIRKAERLQREGCAIM